MLIKEGSKLRLFDDNYTSYPLIDEITANEDIEIDKDGRGYSILLRKEGQDTNSIFESDTISRISEGNYFIHGYFKDSLLVVKRKGYSPAMYGSYMND